MVVSSFAIGLLAKSLFYLGVADAMLVCLFFNIIGVLPVCFFSSLGPVFGLRQMVLSRFWFGWWGVKLSKHACNLPQKPSGVLTRDQLPASMCAPA